MTFVSFFAQIDLIGAVFLFVLISSIILTVLGKAVQLRALPLMMRLLIQGPKSDFHDFSSEKLDPRKALLTAMSTTIGIGNIFGPIVAIAFAGPGTLVAYVVATFLGAASTYTEVFLAMKYRRYFDNGAVEGGPMGYINQAMPKCFSFIYALSCCTLLAAWSMSQSHTIAHMVESYAIPCWATGLFLASITMLAIFYGIGWIAELNSRLVPLMFILYVGSSGFIILCHLDQIPQTIKLILHSFWHPRSLITGIAVYSFFDVLRWGLARALQSSEAGLGTSTIPHSLSQSSYPKQQAVLAMASVYSNGLICLLSGLIFLVSGSYEATKSHFDATVINQIFQAHFKGIGEPLIIIITFLFGFGTILGNSYNGSKCFAYLTRNQINGIYTVLAGLCIALGSVLNIKVVWGYIDYLMVPVALTHSLALMKLSFKEKGMYKLDI